MAYRPTKSQITAQAKSRSGIVDPFARGGKGKVTGSLGPQRGQGLPAATKAKAPSTGGGTAIVNGKPQTIAPAAAPFLTPAQQIAYNAAYGKYGAMIGKLNQGMGNETTLTNQKLAQAQVAHDTSSANDAQNTAARGVFDSSIRATDLNDIDTTLALARNNLNTALWNYNTQYNANVNEANNSWANEQGVYNQMAVSNAQGVTPVVPGAAASGATGTASTGGASAAGAGASAAAAPPKPPKPPTAPKPPIPTGPGHSQPRSSRPGGLRAPVNPIVRGQQMAGIGRGF